MFDVAYKQIQEAHTEGLRVEYHVLVVVEHAEGTHNLRTAAIGRNLNAQMTILYLEIEFLQ